MPLPPGTRSAPYEIVAASILLAIPVVAFLVLQGVLGAGPVDDMFIFARYAENLAAGHGLVFNPGERVEGYSSPLWVSILGAAAALRLDVVTAAPTLSALFAVATVILVSWQAWTTLPRGARVLAPLPGVFLATSPPVALHRGLLSFLTPLSLIAVHLAWRFVYYGALRPNTYFAKADVPDAVRLAGGASVYQGVPRGLSGAPSAARREAREGSRAKGTSAHLSVWISNAAILVSWIAYVTWIGGDHFPMFRFYVPMLPILASGSTLLLRDSFDGPSRRATGSVAACLVLSLVGVGTFHRWVEDRHGSESARGQVLPAEGWGYTGRWMARNFPPTRASPRPWSAPSPTTRGCRPTISSAWWTGRSPPRARSKRLP